MGTYANVKPNVMSSTKLKMTKQERLSRWRAEIRRRGWTVKQAAVMLGVSLQVGYNWNCGLQPIPPARLKQLEELK